MSAANLARFSSCICVCKSGLGILDNCRSPPTILSRGDAFPTDSFSSTMPLMIGLTVCLLRPFVFSRTRFVTER